MWAYVLPGSPACTCGGSLGPAQARTGGLRTPTGRRRRAGDPGAELRSLWGPHFPIYQPTNLPIYQSTNFPVSPPFGYLLLVNLLLMQLLFF
jgi:hypothetical protein